MDDLNRLLINAGMLDHNTKKYITDEIVKATVKSPLTESTENTNTSNEFIEDQENTTFNEKLEIYQKEFQTFMEDTLDECAGVGLNAEHNSYPYTPDIKKGTLKKTGAQMGFDITDDGIPPRVSKDSINK